MNTRDYGNPPPSSTENPRRSDAGRGGVKLVLAISQPFFPVAQLVTPQQQTLSSLCLVECPPKWVVALVWVPGAHQGAIIHGTREETICGIYKGKIQRPRKLRQQNCRTSVRVKSMVEHTT